VPIESGVGHIRCEAAYLVAGAILFAPWGISKCEKLRNWNLSIPPHRPREPITSGVFWDAIDRAAGAWQHD